MQHNYVTPQWPVPAQIKSVSTTRQPGFGTEPFNHFNLGTHVGDDPAVVEKNRAVLRSDCGLPSAPQWLNQVHGCEVHRVDHVTESLPTADATWTNQPKCVLAIMTADCLPVLLASRSGDYIAALHGGWRGLAEGVVEATVDALPVPDPSHLIAWLGPAIGPQHFEVGLEVRSAFLKKSENFRRCFVQAGAPDKYLANIFDIGRLCLRDAGVRAVHGGGTCTFKEKNRFFSHRRDAGKTGRMASLIWISP